MVRIGEIGPGSIAEALELRIGTRIVAVNGEPVRDSLDFAFLAAENELEIEAVEPDGARVAYEINRDGSESLGIVPAPDKVRECANECVFCFIDGNPPGARPPLWVRDDDFRLSFTYGSYVTLTNLGPRGLQRLVDQRISPLYVSVHATDPEVRVRLLKNRRAGLIMDQLRRLLDAELEVHAQVVLCPGWNDGPELDRTIRDLYALGPGVLTLSVVPVGLTRYNVNRPVRLLREGDATEALAQTDAPRKTALRERGHHWCYAADELFLIAGREAPGADYYDDWPLLENGVGALRTLLDAFDANVGELSPITGVERVRIATGGSMRPFFERMAPEVSRRMSCDVDVVAVRNRYFGPTVTVAGLLPGADLAEDVGECRSGDLVLLPADALNADGLFIDGMPLGEVEAALSPAVVRTGRELAETLCRQVGSPSAVSSAAVSLPLAVSLPSAASATTAPSA